MSDQFDAETSTWQHTTLTTDRHVPGGNRTHNLSRRAAADLRLRPRGHRDRQKHVVKVKVKWSRYRPGVAQRVGKGIALLFHDRGTRTRWVVSSTPLPHSTPGKEPVSIVQEAGWAPGPVWTGENLVPTGIRSRSVQLIVSRYTDWATGPQNMQ